MHQRPGSQVEKNQGKVEWREMEAAAPEGDLGTRPCYPSHRLLIKPQPKLLPNED